MFLPLHDNNTLKIIAFQRVTVGLIVLNCLVYLGQLAAGEQIAQGLWLTLGFIPAAFFGPAAAGAPQTAHVPDLVTLVSYSFLHGNVFHLAGNMLFFWVFGDNVEDALGHWRFLAFYLLGAAAAALAEGVLGGTPEAPLIGASGATSACLGAYLVLHPRVRIWILLLMRIPLRLPAYGVIGVWVAMQATLAFTDTTGGIAWFAHLGGFAAGALMAVILRKPGVPLFGGGQPPTAIEKPGPWDM